MYLFCTWHSCLWNGCSILTFFNYFFNVQWTLNFLLASCPAKGCPNSAALNTSELWCRCPQTPLCHSPSCGAWPFGWFVRSGSCPGCQQDWSPPLLPVGGSRWQSQSPAWPWCSAGPHTSVLGAAPLPVSGPAWLQVQQNPIEMFHLPGIAHLYLLEAVLQTDLQIFESRYVSALWVSSQQLLSIVFLLFNSILKFNEAKFVKILA